MTWREFFKSYLNKKLLNIIAKQEEILQYNTWKHYWNKYSQFEIRNFRIRLSKANLKNLLVPMIEIYSSVSVIDRSSTIKNKLFLALKCVQINKIDFSNYIKVLIFVIFSTLIWLIKVLL